MLVKALAEVYIYIKKHNDIIFFFMEIIVKDLNLLWLFSKITKSDNEYEVQNITSLHLIMARL